jgi:threonine/homoserine/homoserine lactone efflux protein
MTESLITISIVGLIAGFVFSMPVAGPISIMITSNALKGRMRYCNHLTIGASIADFIYVFIAVFGLTKLYSTYKPVVPYLLAAGSVFIIYLSYKIFNTKIDLEHLDDKIHIPEKITKRTHRGFYVGLLINFLNPTLFFGWFTTTFIVISLVSSLGFNTGGLDTKMNQNINEINSIKGTTIEKPHMPSYLQLDTLKILKNDSIQHQSTTLPKNFHLLISICYAFFLSLGTIIWFYLLAEFLSRFRNSININILNGIIKGLSIGLCILGFLLAYSALKMLL